MKACHEYEELLSLHATGALEPEEESRVRAHLEACAACRSEAESTARVLSGLALPPPSPAMQERVEALPQRTLGAWRREQVRRAFHARTAGALLAAAAVVLLVVRPSLPRLETPRPPVSIPEAPSEFSETQAAFEQWASADPLGEELDGLLAEDDMEGWGDEAEMDPSESELFLTPDLGELP
ncbi:MAG TPA: zf-HC2 domain-containing protein [Hyalangium sp.]|nr:zf-HC2 domain-containing protein [Hyalangium sp.]